MNNDATGEISLQIDLLFEESEERSLKTILSVIFFTLS